MSSLVSGSILGLEVVEETLEINTTIKIGMNTIKINTPKIIVTYKKDHHDLDTGLGGCDEVDGLHGGHRLPPLLHRLHD